MSLKVRTIDSLIKELQAAKKKHGGDTMVKVHLPSLEDSNGGDFTHDDFNVKVEKMRVWNEDNQRFERKHATVFTIYGSNI